MHTVGYEPAESTGGLFGGNSNWRGPVWFPVNYLVIEALGRYARFYGDDLVVEYPTGSGTKVTLSELAADLSRRLRLIDDAYAARIVTAVEAAGLPSRGPALGADRYLELMRHDKKAEGGEIRFVVIEAPGRAGVRPVADALVRETLAACAG